MCGISNAYSQYSNDPHNPLVVSTHNGNMSNIRIATTENGTTFIAEEQIDLIANEGKINVCILDSNGNIISNSIGISYSIGNKPENDFNLVSSGYNVLLSFGGNLFFKLHHQGGFTLIELQFDSAKLVEDPIIAGTSVDINDENEIVFAVPFLNDLYINKLTPDGDIASSGNVIDGYNTMPKVCFIEDGSFYVVYRIYERLYADYYDKNCNNVWKAIYVGHETGSDLSHNEPHQIIPDGLGGIYVIWKKKNIYVQRITTEDNGFEITGIRKFTDYGMELTENTTECYNPLVSVDKNTNDLNITWRSQNQNTNSVNLQKITPDGEKTWGTNGIIVDESILSHHNTPAAIGTAGDKIVLVFSKYNTTSQDYDLVYNRYYIGTGNKDFADNIDVNISKYKRNSVVATDFINNQIVVAWSDSTNDEQVRTLAQNITYNGILGPDTLSINDEEASICSVFPLPASDEINIKYISKSTTIATIQIFDYLGKLVFEENNFDLNIGENIITINKIFPVGEYNILLTAGSEKITQKVIFK
ncbi:MAG: T9SS type A sorting domain-containing protein [Bacteroidetes bacterium]|nr:T9SS type A sorting domain-containing protein [Bacteroidota bacterium]